MIMRVSASWPREFFLMHIRPGHKNKYGDDLPARFDTVLVREQANADQRGVHCEFYIA